MADDTCCTQYIWHWDRMRPAVVILPSSIDALSIGCWYVPGKALLDQGHDVALKLRTCYSILKAHRTRIRNACTGYDGDLM